MQPSGASQLSDEVDPHQPVAANDGALQLDYSVRRGAFRQRVLITGELRAAQAVRLRVPQTQIWNAQIRWIIDNGTRVSPGDRLVEFDNSALVSELEDRKLAAVESANQLALANLENESETAEKELAVKRTEIETEKARLRADIPENLISRREYQEFQIALLRAETEHKKAQEGLDAYRQSSAADLEIKVIALDQANREIAQIEKDLESLELIAPESGMALLEPHPWEDRNLGVGDSVWAGWTIVTLPHLESLEVDALLSDVDDGEIAVGMLGVCRLDAYPDQTVPCRVREIAPMAQPTSPGSLRRGFRVLIDLERIDPEKMRPGMSVLAEIESQRQEDLLLVPRGTVDFAAEPPQVLLAGGGRAEVDLGSCNALECVLEAGLDEGQRLQPLGNRP